MAGAAAYAGTNWVISLGSGSSGKAQSMTVTTVSITAAVSKTPAHLLYPGSDGDVTVTITNHNTFPVTITGVTLPTATTFAAGYSSSTLTATNAEATCTKTNSKVYWNGAGSATAHTLATAIIVAKQSSVTVTLTDEAIMTTQTPQACENTWFKMPSLTGISATSTPKATWSNLTATTAIDHWAGNTWTA